MLNNPIELKAALLPYLREFIERASAETLTLPLVKIPEDLRSICDANGVSLKTSFGKGEPASVPWLACFLPGQSASAKGVYPVILFDRDRTSLSVCYGVSATGRTEEGQWKEKWPREWPSSLVYLSHTRLRLRSAW